MYLLLSTLSCIVLYESCYTNKVYYYYYYYYSFHSSLWNKEVVPACMSFLSPWSHVLSPSTGVWCVLGGRHSTLAFPGMPAPRSLTWSKICTVCVDTSLNGDPSSLCGGCPGVRVFIITQLHYFGIWFWFGLLSWVGLYVLLVVIKHRGLLGYWDFLRYGFSVLR